MLAILFQEKTKKKMLVFPKKAEKKCQHNRERPISLSSFLLDFHLINLVICSSFVSSAILVAGWNLTILNADSTSFDLQWTGLDASFNHRAEFYLIEVKSAEGILLAVKTVPGNTSSTDIKGLNPSSTYHLVVFGVDETGQPYKSSESVVTTKKGMNTWVKCLHINACYIYSLCMVLFKIYFRKKLLGKFRCTYQSNEREPLRATICFSFVNFRQKCLYKRMQILRQRR